jgi:C1A family cysteine protease
MSSPTTRKTATPKAKPVPVVPIKKHEQAKDRVYGWHPSQRASKSPRYFARESPHVLAAPLPASVDLEPGCPPVYDQLQLGSCTANALAGLFQFLQMLLGLPNWVPSRLFIYRGERSREGTIATDSGANGDDGVNFLDDKGVCPETLWPYDPSQFAAMPPSLAWSTAFHNKLSNTATIGDGDVEAMKSWLANEKTPIAFGFAVYAEMESEAVGVTGIVPDPHEFEQPIGGHEVLLVGYDDATGRFKFRNSWGPKWGLAGYGTLSYEYVGNPQLASDFRSARTVN